jgi:hypothetical protein
MAQRQPPRFTGVDTYQDRLGRFSIRYPTDWLKSDLLGRDGTMVFPNSEDRHTSLSMWVDSLEVAVVAEDLEELKVGVCEGLANSRVEEASEVVLGNLIKFERVFTFRENGATRKRKMWLLYVDRWLIVVLWQGSSEEEYDYWLAMANYSFATFTLPEALWFATDRDLFRADANRPF